MLTRTFFLNRMEKKSETPPESTKAEEGKDEQNEGKPSAYRYDCFPVVKLNILKSLGLLSFKFQFPLLFFSSNIENEFHKSKGGLSMTLPKLKKTKTGDVTDPDLKPKVPFLLKPRYLPALLKTVAA
jgi:hypothetical protein